ncbi:MAG TPA: efflux transporter outer membrane subunit [Stellaceae bacterium]|nr:efflux transporter outer membrane subunit [Stellaceae bacterium]
MRAFSLRLVITKRPVLALLAALAGCTVGPDYHPPATTAPDQWAGAKSGAIDTTATAELDHWWAGFNDPVLNDLVERAIAANYDLKLATERVVQARAERDVSAAGFYPSVSLQPNATRNRSSTALKFPPYGGVYNTYQAGFDASWEIDIFGGTRRSVEAADAAIGASIEDRRAMLVSLLGDLGTDYAALRAAQARLAIAQRNITAEQDALSLTQQKFSQGLGNELDVAQARAQLETLRAVVPQLQTTAAVQAHAIAVLIGRVPSEVEAELSKPGALPPSPPVLPATTPSSVVRNRPDIREAERNLAGANAKIGVAVAQLFPTFSLSPTIGVGAGSLNKLLTSGALQWGFGPSVSVPIFQGGKLDANVREARSVAEQNRLTYEKTVLTAFQEVEDALVSYTSERQRHDNLARALEANQLALRRSTELYRGGIGDFLAVLDSERNLYSAEDSVAQSDLAIVQQTVALYKAMGGGWQELDPQPPAVATQ